MNVRDFRAELSKAFQAEGFREQRLCQVGPKVWTLPADEIVPFFSSDAQRRHWGFVLFGVIGIEIPALRLWLDEHKPGPASGIFQSGFIGYYTSNEQVFGDFQILHGSPIPSDLWVGLIKDRLRLIPRSLDELLATYRTNREVLGWLAHPNDKAAWDFLIQWRHSPDPALHVPYRLPTGEVVTIANGP